MRNGPILVSALLASLALLVGCSRQVPSSGSQTVAGSPDHGAGHEGAAPATRQDSIAFSGDSALRHVRVLAERIGPRVSGSPALDQAVDYVTEALVKAGYEPRRHPYELPDGKSTVNITAVRKGDSSDEIVLAAHLETVVGSPGANDDASGVGVMLELAEMLAGAQVRKSVRFVFLSAEEALEGHEEHGLSGLELLEGLSDEEVAAITAACWLDKVSAGPELHLMYVRGASDTAARRLAGLAAERGLAHRLISSPRWSKRMAFEDRGVPTVWVEYSPAPELHKPGDGMRIVDQAKLAAVGRLVHQWLTEGAER